MSWRPQEEKPKETCPTCAPHPPHRGQCFAMGISTPCPCAPGVSKDQLDELWIERNAGRIPSGRMPQ